MLLEGNSFGYNYAFITFLLLNGITYQSNKIKNLSMFNR